MESTATFKVHRCRFVDYVPSAITALAFPPNPLPSLKGKNRAASLLPSKPATLAIGRANGNIELCEWSAQNVQTQAHQAWVLNKILAGPIDSKVDSLVFTLRDPYPLHIERAWDLSNLRLFSAGGGSELLEWDLETGAVLRSVSSQGGTIWCLAANPVGNLLAIGCEDGSVRILSLENDNLLHTRRFDKTKARLLSVAWGPPVYRNNTKSNTKPKSAADDDSSSDSDDEDETDWSDSWLVTGCSDSSIRKWDFATGRVVERMWSDKVRGQRTLVWAVAVLSDGTVVSGDSMGAVKFWDSRTCIQLFSFQGHSADVLCLTVGPEGRSVFSSGVDQKITQFALVNQTSPNDPGRWVQTVSRRFHSHDVRALATWPSYSIVHQSPPTFAFAPILISGGLDMSLNLCPCAPPSVATKKLPNLLSTGPVTTFEDSYNQRTPYTTGTSPAISVAGSAKILICRQERTLSVWKLDLIVNNVGNEEPIWFKVAEAELNPQTNLTTSAISANGRWIAISDFTETRLFKLEVHDDQYKLKRVKVLTSKLRTYMEGQDPSLGAAGLVFSPDSTRLIISSWKDSLIYVVELLDHENDVRVLRAFDHHVREEAVIRSTVDDESDDDMGVQQISRKRQHLAILRLAISQDGQWLASTDTLRRTHIFNLDAVKHHCSLPSFPHPVTALAFEPTSSTTLVLGLSNNTLQVFDVESRLFPEWSRVLSRSNPKRFTQLHDPLLGIAFDPGHDLSANVSSGTDQVPNPDKAPTGRHAIIWGSSWISRVRLDAPKAQDGAFGSSKKRRRSVNSAASKSLSMIDASEGAETQGQDAHAEESILTKYRPLLFLDFVTAQELIVVERPLVDVLRTLPPAYFRARYGK
ncbi:WD40 repeat-like protein [Sistotremastrum niveocremeum HHB9708]|uniref:WD40 repeat-like protein n=2 Tax=Sistotremastraceae TaxID=3402574 RepID=A0A164XNR3_9AGAM|nr:WD40 repeat-like protein [Sistotremastrum niveocremeum HHB9708]KZT44510.1 WD40 repeat-like protein [Sistotremastrum suecicum HHB10207 ss-3]